MPLELYVLPLPVMSMLVPLISRYSASIIYPGNKDSPLTICIPARFMPLAKSFPVSNTSKNIS